MASPVEIPSGINARGVTTSAWGPRMLDKDAAAVGALQTPVALPWTTWPTRNVVEAWPNLTAAYPASPPFPKGTVPR